MTTFTKLSTLILGGSLLALSAYSTASQAQSTDNAKANMQEKHQKMDGEHKGMTQKMKMGHGKMSKMDMSKVDMSKLSSECQTMVSKMADKHKDGSMHSGIKGHDMSKMKDHGSKKMEGHDMKGHDMSKMKDHGSKKMEGHDMKGHDMSKMKGHDMSKMKDHGSEKMKAKMATHKKCMAEMKEAIPHEH